MLLFSLSGAWAGGEKAVSGEGWARLGEDTTPAVAKAAALNNARRDALEKAVGVAVRGTSVVYNFELISDLVTTATKGVIVREEMLGNDCTIEGGGIACHARIRAWVKPLDLGRRGTFRIRGAEILRYGAEHGMSNPVFQNSDEIQVRATSNRDAFFHIFGVDQYGNITRLYPNDAARTRPVLKGEAFVFPAPEQRAQGLALKVRAPSGLSRAIESVLFIATTAPVDLLEKGAAENPTLSDLMMELSGLSPSVWTDKVLGYEVRK